MVLDAFLPSDAAIAGPPKEVTIREDGGPEGHPKLVNSSLKQFRDKGMASLVECARYCHPAARRVTILMPFWTVRYATAIVTSV
jgi:hypothetical protein